MKWSVAAAGTVTANILKMPWKSLPQDLAPWTDTFTVALSVLLPPSLATACDPRHPGGPRRLSSSHSSMTYFLSISSSIPDVKFILYMYFPLCKDQICILERTRKISKRTDSINLKTFFFFWFLGIFLVLSCWLNGNMENWRGKKKKNLLPKGSRADLRQFTLWSLSRNLYGTHHILGVS